MMKRIVKTLLSVILSLGLSISTFAAMSQNIEDHTSIIFSETTIFTQDEQELITIALSGGDSIQQYGLYCTLFGHDYKEEVVTQIRHNVKPVSPKCIKDTFIVNICARCSDIQKQLIGSTPIVCC